jgi:hypothetical protein
MKALRMMKRQEDADMRKVLRIGFYEYDRTKKMGKNCAKAMKSILACRTAELGGFAYPCDCGETVILYKPCHCRSCPMCNAGANAKWREFHKERLVETKYLHIVFVQPEEYNEAFLKDKKTMSDILFKVIYRILRKRYGAINGGIIMIEHTAGSTLTLHPHIHCLVMLGVFDEETNKFREVSADRYNVSTLEKEFEEEYKKEYEKVTGKKENRLYSKDGFKVWKEAKYMNSAEAVIGYFAKGVRGGCISNDRILEVTETTVTIAIKNEQTKGEWSEMELSINEFIKRVLLHIPLEKQKLVRKYGVFASSKRKILERCKEVVEKRTVKLKTKKETIKAEREIKEKLKVICPKCKEIIVNRIEIAPVRNEYKDSA